MKILAIDIGGTKVKMLASGHTEPRKAPSGKTFTPPKLVEEVSQLASDWKYEAISIGIPAPAGLHGPRSEPGNLGCGWVGFDYAAAFGKPVKIVNDAAMQAIGAYEGGRMLFLGLGTGLGAALIAERMIVSLELGNLPWRSRRATLGRVLGRRGLKRFGEAKWRAIVYEAVPDLMRAFLADYVVVGGGNSKRLDAKLPHGIRLGHNLTAFRGGFRLWGVEDVPALIPDSHTEPLEKQAPVEWRMI
jgi:polyphosphate glucokinase